MRPSSQLFRAHAADRAALSAERAARNLLLQLLPPEEYDALEPDLEHVALELGTVLAEPGQPPRHVYFPATCVVSVVSVSDGANGVEVGTIGNEGMAGISVFLDAAPPPDRTFVQVAGEAWRIPVDRFTDSAERLPGLQRLLRRYTHAYLVQVSQTAACNRLHDIEQRCARWLLMTHDRVERAPRFALTQEFLAIMLGVRRASVSEAAGALQARGLIEYSWGKIAVLDRAGLEAAACECYGVVRDHFARTFGLSATA
jgi:CRP-like cAMP-binding protein